MQRALGTVSAEEYGRDEQLMEPGHGELPDWFDTIKEIKVSSELYTKRWNTKDTSRDRLYLEKLGVITS